MGTALFIISKYKKFKQKKIQFWHEKFISSNVYEIHREYCVNIDRAHIE